MSFWHQIVSPIVGLAPMDGITDQAFRLIISNYQKPDVFFTEFVNVEGLARNAVLMLDDFIYSEIERPIVAQIYGSEPESFYKISMVVCELGFDGIDINMGCPAKKVARRGCGAGLIRNPKLSQKIIYEVRRGVADWVEGKSIGDLGFKARMTDKIKSMNEPRAGEARTRRSIPISVKTRLGIDSVSIEEWLKYLLETEVEVVSIHGRTLKQMYAGEADWEAIGRAVEIAKSSPTLILGNGDLQGLEDVERRVKQTGVDGVLIGRAAMGRPWIFQKKEVVVHNIKFCFEAMTQHAELFEKLKGLRRFAGMRKHLACYCKGMPGAANLRNRLMQTKCAEDVRHVLEEYNDFVFVDATRA